MKPQAKTITGRIKREEVPIKKAPIPVVGKIKIGEKDEQGQPRSLDHFKAVGKYAESFKKAYGDTPTNIQIIFISDNILQSCFERWECRKGAKLSGYGDGVNYFLFNEKSGDYEAVEDKEAEKERILKAGKWEQILTLRFVIPKIPGIFGLWEISTKGERSSIGAIVSTFDEVLLRAGSVVNIPFDLCVDMVKSQKPGSKSKFPVLSLVPNLSPERLDTIRAFYQLGSNEVKKLGMLTEEKVSQLQIKALPNG